jgi:hypothetical protein
VAWPSLLRDEAACVEVEQRLGHGLHAELALPDLELRVELVDLVLADQVADGGIGNHHLDRQDAPAPVHARDELLRDDPVQDE